MELGGLSMIRFCLREDQAVDGLTTATAIIPSITPVLCLYCTLHRTNHSLKLHPAARSFSRLVAIHVITHNFLIKLISIFC